MKKFDRERGFEVDGIHYVVGLTAWWEFHLYVDAVSSGIRVAQSKIERQFGDEPESEIWTSFPTKSVFRVKRQVLRFIDQAIRFYKPEHFTFSANELHKERLYRRFANKIAKQYGYFLQETSKGRFEFYHVKESVKRVRPDSNQ